MQYLSEHIVKSIREHVLPKSKYSTSMQGLSWSQVFNSPLPPYLSPLPVIFRVLAYLAIAPVVVLLILDFGGYIVFRIYDQPFWSGTRTAFYKFRQSPVFSLSRQGSPKLVKGSRLPAVAPTSASSAGSKPGSSAAVRDVGVGLNSSGSQADGDASPSPQFGKDASLSPVSSSTSLNDYEYNFSGPATEDENTSPPSPVLGFQRNGDLTLERQTTLTPENVASLPSRLASNSGSTPTTPNSLGLGLGQDEAAAATASTAEPVMYFVESGSAVPLTVPGSASSTAEQAPTKSSASPTSSVGSNLDEDDKAFREAREAITSTPTGTA